MLHLVLFAAFLPHTPHSGVKWFRMTKDSYPTHFVLKGLPYLDYIGGYWQTEKGATYTAQCAFGDTSLHDFKDKDKAAAFVVDTCGKGI